MKRTAADDGNERNFWLGRFLSRFRDACEVVALEPAAVSVMHTVFFVNDIETEARIYIVAKESIAHAALERVMQQTVPDETFIAGYCVRRPADTSNFQ